MASVNFTGVGRGPAPARLSSNTLLEAAKAGWATTIRLAFLLVVRGVGWAGIGYVFYRSGLDALV